MPLSSGSQLDGGDNGEVVARIKTYARSHIGNRGIVDDAHAGRYIDIVDSLPEPLKDAALLRIANPEASLADLSVLSYPKVSKSTLAYRLKRLENFRPDPEE